MEKKVLFIPRDRKWHTVKIFISSTFKDMDKERDILRLVVEPQLNNFFRHQYLHINFVDLRKDVETDKNLSTEQREKQVFDICMKEIEQCSPYFIGLIGDRYGWIPPQHVLDLNSDIYISESIVSDAPLKKSVTFYEFMKGIFVNGKVSPTALIYMRKTKESEDKNLEVFKGLINKIYGPPQKLDSSNGTFKEYSITDVSNENGCWAQTVFEDIKQTIKLNLLKFENESLDLADVIDAEQEKFIYEKTKQFYGRTEELNTIDSNIKKHKECFLVKKSPGIGASSLMCKAYLNCQTKDYFCLFHSTQASENSVRTEDMFYRWCWLLEEELGCLNIKQLREIYNDKEALSDCLVNLISLMYKRNMRVVVFVDGMQEDAMSFFYRVLNKITLIQIIENKDELEGDLFKFLSENGEVILIDEIDSSIKERILKGQRNVVCKHLIRRKESGNPLWLTTACFIINHLTIQDYISIRSRAEKDNEKKIDAYIKSFIQRIPHKMEDVALFWMEKLGEVYDLSYVNKYLSLYAYSREGWSDEVVAMLVGGTLGKCISFRQSCGNIIFEQSESGLWRMKADIAAYWKKKHDFDMIFFLMVKEYLYLLPREDDARRMNLFCFARLTHDTNTCKEIMLQDNTPDPYENISLKDFLALFHEEPNEGHKLMQEIMLNTKELNELLYIYYWCTFLRSFGLSDNFIAIHEAFVAWIANISGSDITSFDQNWNVKYNILLYYVDHYKERKQTEKVIDIAEKCQKNLLEQILQNHKESAQIQVVFFHWCDLYMSCLPKIPDRIFYANRIIHLVKYKKIALSNEAKMNYCIFLYSTANYMEELGYYEKGIELLLHGLNINIENLEYLDTIEMESERLRNEGYDNYCLGIINLFHLIAKIGEAPRKYRKQIETAMQFARKAKTTWSVDPMSYYEVLFYYLQSYNNEITDDNLQLMDEAIEMLEKEMISKSNHPTLQMLLAFYAYKEMICTKKKRWEEYYAAFKRFEGVSLFYNEIIKAHKADYEDSLIYHQYASVLSGLQSGNYIKVLKEGNLCLEECRNAIGNGNKRFSHIADYISNVLSKLSLEGYHANDETSRLLVDKFLQQEQYGEIFYLIIHMEQKIDMDFYKLAYCYFRLGEYNEAIKQFERILSSFQMNQGISFAVKVNLLIAYIQTGRDDDFQKFYDTFNVAEKNDSIILDIVTAHNKRKATGNMYDGPKEYTYLISKKEDESIIGNNITHNENDKSETSNSYDNIERLMSLALENKDIISEEKDIEKCLKQILEEPKQNTTLLSKAYFLSGIVQLQKKVWFKAYDKLEKSIKIYEYNNNAVAPVFIYEKLADAYIKSHNNTFAKTLLNNAIQKSKNAGKKEEELISLQNLLNSILPAKEQNSIDKENVPSEEIQVQSFWDRLLSLFRKQKKDSRI